MSPICCDERPRDGRGREAGGGGAADRGTGDMLRLSAGAGGIRQPVTRAASSAWLTSASASAFCARGTLRTRQRRELARAPSVRRACSGFMSGCLTLYSPLTCLATSSESLTTSTSVGAERARAVEAEQQPAVLGDVVRRDAEQLVRLVEDVAVGRRDARPPRRPAPGCRGRRRRRGRRASRRRYSRVDRAGTRRDARAPAVADGALLGAARRRPCPRRSLLRRSMMTFTFGSSL